MAPSVHEETRMSSGQVYPELVLYVTQDKFYLQPTSNRSHGVKPTILTIDRVKGDLEEIAYREDGFIADSVLRRQEIYGLLGCIELLAGKYLVIVTGREKVGIIGGHDIWCVKSTQLLMYSRTTTHLSEAQVRMDKEYKAMIELILNTPNVYFSYSYDLTHSLQRLHNISPDFFQNPLHVRADKRFVWNYHLLQTLTTGDNASGFCLPVIMGFVSINTCVLNGKTFTYSVVSRRSRFRCGTRLFTRGVDSTGNVANFVETEQIVETQTDRASFVQTRGSMPFFWHQWPNLKYKPSPKILENENHREAFTKHFDSQILEYGRQVIVNLVNQKGSEGNLESFYKELVNEIGNPDIRYEAFDFHAECAKMRWDRLRILTDRLAHDQEQLGVMMIVNDSNVVSQQEGVFRTNCIDCLDRTNVVQSMLARNSLTYVLQKLNLLRSGQRVEDQAGLESLFKSIWADNADFISVQYSGTGALKTDFTRTGKRSWQGIINDGLNSVTRYYRNNFTHGFRQDSLDLFQGNYNVKPEEGVLMQSPLEVHRGWRVTTFPLILLVAVAMFFANLISSSDDYPKWETWALVSQLFWGSMIAATLATILYYGKEFVDSPRLTTKCPTTLTQP